MNWVQCTGWSLSSQAVSFNGAVAPVNSDLTDRGLIRVLDLLVVTKDPDGSLETFEIRRSSVSTRR